MAKNDDSVFGRLIRVFGTSVCVLGVLILFLSPVIIISIRDCVEDNKKAKKEKAEYENAVKMNIDSTYIDFMNEYRNGEYFEKVDSILWERALSSSDYAYYIKNVPRRNTNEKHFYAARDSLEQIEEKKWGMTDAEAWHRAQEINTAESYRKYINKYPNGIKIEQAEKLVIDKEVDDIFSGSHGELPAMNKISGRGGKTSNISVYNNTPYTLTLRYSGDESKSIEIPYHSRGNILLKNGAYRIAASVNANVRSFAGTEILTGGSYDVEYYIVTTRH